MQTVHSKLIQRDALKPLLQGQGQLICILDSCRYDVFEQVNWLSGKLSKVISAGSTTTEWARETFDDFYPNVVYFSSIPYIAAKINLEEQKAFLGLEHFPIINDLWWWAWDEGWNTVLPEIVAHTVLQVRKDSPHKTIIAHFVQPHSPCIGSPPFTEKTWTELTGEQTDRFPHLDTIFTRGFGEEYKEAYRGNLARVIKVIDTQLRPHFDHITITADHGEGFGENEIYGHREGIRTPELLEVPWFQVT